MHNAPSSSTASHDDHEKINSWVSFSYMGMVLGGPSGRWSSAIMSRLAILPVLRSQTKTISLPALKQDAEKLSVLALNQVPYVL